MSLPSEILGDQERFLFAITSRPQRVNLSHVN